MSLLKQPQFDEYVDGAIRTDLSPEQYEQAYARMKAVFRLQHAITGLTTEIGELADQIKKHVFYGKPLDGVNLKEETGDLFWYMALLCDELGEHLEVNVQDILDTNIAKLRARYPEKFDGEQAINRNVEAERKLLENSGSTRHGDDSLPENRRP